MHAQMGATSDEIVRRCATDSGPAPGARRREPRWPMIVMSSSEGRDRPQEGGWVSMGPFARNRCRWARDQPSHVRTARGLGKLPPEELFLRASAQGQESESAPKGASMSANRTRTEASCCGVRVRTRRYGCPSRAEVGVRARPTRIKGARSDGSIASYELRVFRPDETNIQPLERGVLE